MRSGLYGRLAWNNIKSNHRFFVPRILSEAGLLCCFYISFTLSMDERLKHVKGGYVLPTFMAMSTAVLAILSAVLMLYINSFVMKQRTREFGMYNVLGMEKRHIGKVLLRETMISSLTAITLGLSLGIAFYKLCSLLICHLLHADLVLGFYYISIKTVLPAALFFLLLDLFTYLVNRIRIAILKPVELLRSLNAGEKEPTVKWPLLVLGLITLGAGYYLALTIDNPVDALTLFFIAVVLVMAGTYFLFVSGSIFILKRLKNNKRYYYKKNHMPAVSGMLYRMKQNAVGLASIAILATGVLIMLSTTVSLYTGFEGILKKTFPKDYYLSADSVDAQGNEVEIPADKLELVVRDAARKNGVEIKSVDQETYLEVMYRTEQNELKLMEVDESLFDIQDFGDLKYYTECFFVTADEYERLTGEKLELKEDELAVCRKGNACGNVLNLKKSIRLNGQEYLIKTVLTDFPTGNNDMEGLLTTYGMVVKDEQVLNRIYSQQKAGYGRNASPITQRIAVAFADKEEAANVSASLQSDITQGMNNLVGPEIEYDQSGFWEAMENLLGLYGTLLFLGILLGAVCIFATTLIIYYKQISEGYEDRERFQIMEKIGMSQREVKRTINSQVLMVFLLPLVVAAIHMVVAFPLLNKILKLLELYSFNLFLVCTLITFAIFALAYMLIYKATSRVYYKIVH